MKTISKSIAAAVIAASATMSAPALAAGGTGKLVDHEFSFDGVFGTFDQAQLQRGYQVYSEVCAGCHGMQYVSFRTLGDENGPGFSEEQVKAIAANYQVVDPEGEPGDTKEGEAFDYFPVPYAEGNPPDMSLLAKARPGGADHIYSILMGYTGEEKEEAGAILYENTAMDGGWIGMAPPVGDGWVEYTDGSPETLGQYSEDVAAFLMWAAEPKMMERKQAGVRNVLFLILFAVLLYFTNKKVWRKVKHPEA